MLIGACVLPDSRLMTGRLAVKTQLFQEIKTNERKIERKKKKKNNKKKGKHTYLVGVNYAWLKYKEVYLPCF